jgi:hypothetical protein
MVIRNLIPWIRNRDMTIHRGPDTDNATVYIVKWIPKDQDVIIDHSTRYGDSSPAMQFAVNALHLSPKRIWIEDGKGVIHADHETILDRIRTSTNEQPAVTFPTPDGQHAARPVDTVLSQVDAHLEEPILTTTGWVDWGQPPRADDHVIPSEIELLLDEPSTVNEHTVDQVFTKQDPQQRVNMVLAEIQDLLAEPLPMLVKQANSEIGDFDARPTVETKSLNLLTANGIERKHNGPEMSDPVVQEVEALLGISAALAKT